MNGVWTDCQRARQPGRYGLGGRKPPLFPQPQFPQPQGDSRGSRSDRVSIEIALANWYAVLKPLTARTTGLRPEADGVVAALGFETLLGFRVGQLVCSAGTAYGKQLGKSGLAQTRQIG